MDYKISKIANDYEERKKDIYTLKYKFSVLRPSIMTDYSDYSGPWPSDMESVLKNIEDTVLEQGKFLTVPMDSRTHLKSGLYIEWFTGRYHVLNCILEQDVHLMLNDSICYTLSIMGRLNQADNLYSILHGDFSNSRVFKNVPEAKRYENKDGLRTENFNSIEDLESKLRLIATMDYSPKGKKKHWNWVE